MTDAGVPIGFRTALAPDDSRERWLRERWLLQSLP